MARLSSVLLLWALCVCAFGQAFGRFGYHEFPTIPGLLVDKEGIVAKHPAADKLRFATAVSSWKPSSITPFGATVVFDTKAWQPQKVRFNLLGPGVSVYFPQGIRFRVTSTAPPYLTWTEGSVTSGVPTPDVSWLILSFRDNQPPIVFGFPGPKAGLQIAGKAGDWEISSALSFTGWVRVGLPLGPIAQAANSAGALGRLAKSMTTQEVLWTQLPPDLVRTEVNAELASVEGVWHFDKPGAVLPLGAQFSSLGGYPIKIVSPVTRAPIVTEEGPVDFVKGDELRIRFPIRRVPAGRCLAVGATLSQAIGTVSPLDIPSIVDLALEGLTAGRDAITRKTAEDTLAEYLGQANYVEEKWTGQKLPFDATGNDLDLSAAHALLMQALAATTKPQSEANSLLTSIAWSQDWSTWLPASSDREKARRAAALTALAGALCPEPERRLTAAMFQAGMAAERGFATWQRRRGVLKADPQLLEPLPGLRRGLFSLTWPLAETTDFASNLLGPVRLFSEGAAILEKRENDLVLTWQVMEPKPSILTMAGAYPLQVDALKNLARCESATTLGMLELRYTPDVAGTCEVKLVLPEWAKAPPLAAAVPRYSEPKIGPNQR